jgi:glycosyltransferase involved in cell wall biosynthesis
MAMEKAVISTTIGAEGLPVTDGVDVLLADEPAAFAEAVARVLTDSSYANELGRRAAANVREHHGWRQVTEKFVAACLSSAGAEPGFKPIGELVAH